MKPTIINLIFAIFLIIGKIFLIKIFLNFFLKQLFNLDEKDGIN